MLTENDDALYSPIVSTPKRIQLVEKPNNDPNQKSPNSKSNISCTICNINFTRKDNLMRHTDKNILNKYVHNV